MAVSRVFTEAFHRNPPSASERLYAKGDSRDPIFHDSGDCYIDAYCHLLNPLKRHCRIKSVTDLTEFCEVSAGIVLV